jgi:hypothetical protein
MSLLVESDNGINRLTQCQSSEIRRHYTDNQFLTILRQISIRPFIRDWRIAFHNDKDSDVCGRANHPETLVRGDQWCDSEYPTSKKWQAEGTPAA